MLDSLFSLVSYDIGIDLGTANSLVLVKGKGIVIREPSVVAIHKKTKDILAIGSDARRMIGKTPTNILVVRPLRDGVISDFGLTTKMLEYFIKKVHKTPSLMPKIPRPKIIIGIPSSITEVERRAVAKAACSAGARSVFLIEEVMAAAIGVGLSVLEPKGMLIVDSGGGTTEIALISLGGTVINRSIRIAGDKMDIAIVDYARKKHNLLIGEKTAEELKINVGSVEMNEKNKERKTFLRGRDLKTGLPKEIEINANFIVEALEKPVSIIIENIKQLVEEIPPEFLSDVIRNGVTLVGGTSLLPGLAQKIASETKIPVVLAEDALTCVVHGCGYLLSDQALLERVKVR